MTMIYNTTFVIHPEQEKQFLEWSRDVLIPSLFNEESPACNPALRKVVEAGGEKPDPEHGLSIALHAEFENAESARKWNDEFLLPALAGFHLLFGPETVFFTTMLESILI